MAGEAPKTALPSAGFEAAARTDTRDWLICADEPLAGLQLRCGGTVPGPIIAPALLQLVRQARAYGLKLGRAIKAQDDQEQISAWVEVTPDQSGNGCDIRISNWQILALQHAGESSLAHRAQQITRQLAELTATLGPQQELLAFETAAVDLELLAGTMRDGLGRPWTDFLFGQNKSLTKPLHWRLLDGAEVDIAGSDRKWRVHLNALGHPEVGSAGFELYLVADSPEPDPKKPVAEPAASNMPPNTSAASNAGLGREIAPVLRQPVSRIIANAETIRSQMAGPLADEYSNYAADIATAGTHLLALIDDLTALEMIEDEQFSPAPDQIDLADLAQRAKGILGMRARERGIEVVAPPEGTRAPAIGEFRRVLQILLNLIGNALRYAPEGSQVLLAVISDGQRSRITVSDEGEGLSQQQQALIWKKFERLGRQGDGGSGLGLYISRRLAEAMGGTLTVESDPGQGARFTLDLPADKDSAAD